MDFTKRIDLHCHSRASTEADEAMLQAIRCPESYSEPREIYAQAKERGMDFVTITDHDSIAGVAELAGVEDVLVGEELTCYFPEDRCKIHLLVWGISSADHDALQRAANDIYAVARYVRQHRIAHAVAHPLYRQNGVLDRRHVERLILIFNGFECLNGAHSMTHREVFEPLLDELDAAGIRRLERAHGLEAAWPKPWIKTRTAGSDDHGLFNIGRTWTQFPAETRTVDQLLECLREGRCRPGGEAGSSIKLAHNFFGVGMRYYTRQLAESKNGGSGRMMRRVLGEEAPPGRLSAAATACGFYARGIPRRIGRFLGIGKPARGTKLLGELLASSVMKRAAGAGALLEALKEGRSPLAEHRPMFDLVCGVDRDVAGGIFDAVAAAIDHGELGAMMDAISAVIAHQALLLPYLFALFHQNQERDLLNELSKRSRSGAGDFPRVGVFTDSADESKVAGRFVADLGRFAEARGLPATIHLASRGPEAAKNWRNFAPVIDRKIAGLAVELKIPPVLEILEWSDRRQFDVILVNTAGPMGLCGWLVSKMLRAPMIAVCHDDLPARMLEMTGGDYRLTAALEGYVAWLYRSAAKVLTMGQGAAKISGIRQRRLPAEDPLDSVWDACVRAAEGRESEDGNTAREALLA
jgi:hypothetical protein